MGICLTSYEPRESSSSHTGYQNTADNEAIFSLIIFSHSRSLNKESFFSWSENISVFSLFTLLNNTHEYSKTVTHLFCKSAVVVIFETMHQIVSLRRIALQKPRAR